MSKHNQRHHDHIKQLNTRVHPPLYRHKEGKSGNFFPSIDEARDEERIGQRESMEHLAQVEADLRDKDLTLVSKE